MFKGLREQEILITFMAFCLDKYFRYQPGVSPEVGPVGGGARGTKAKEAKHQGMGRSSGR